jgi:uncharacterized lipoprotein YmbA
MKNIHLLLLAVTLLLLAGCIGTPTRPSDFYVLDSQPGSPVGRSVRESPLQIELGPLILPEIYERPQIVTRNAANRIMFAEFDRWGGELGKDLARVLTHNLMTRLNTESIVPYPWPGRYRPDFQIGVHLFRFDGALGEQVELEGIWRILDGAVGCELAAEGFTITETSGGPGYVDLVGAMSRGVATLSQQLAERIVTMEPGCAQDTANQ